ncbi:MAG TPA: hypothetical protein VEK13_03710 [Thermoplasmata archaeon]|nr:hypothetical protein [Thermoplasmata archaeon]
MYRTIGRTFLPGACIAVLFAVLVLATPLVAGQSEPAPSARASSSVSNGKAAYAGYLGVVTSENISSQIAEFSVPSVTCQSSLPEAQVVSVHIGASGVLSNGSTVEVGMNLVVICDLGSSAPRYAPLAYDCVETNCTTLVVFSLSISPGDNLSFQIQTNPLSGKVVWKMTDQSTDASASWVEEFNHGVNLTRPFWEVAGPNYPCTPTSCAQALAKFSGRIFLHDCRLTVSGARVEVGALAFLIKYTLVNSIGTVLARCSSLSNHGSAFSVTWVRST